MKKGLALLLTLSFILIGMGIVGSILMFYNRISSNSFEYSITQDKLIINSVKEKLSSIKIENQEDLDKLLNLIYLIDTKNFSAKVTISPINDRFNINQLVTKNKINDTFSDVFNNFCNINDISECNFLKNLILDTIDTDNEERSEYSEIKNYQPFKNGKIESFTQLNIISKYYYAHTNDKNIFNVKWENFFNVNGNYLDCDIINKQTANILNIETYPITCKTIKYNFNDFFLKKLDIISFNKKRAFYINIHIIYNFHNLHTLDILYDIKTKRIISIEKHFIY